MIQRQGYSISKTMTVLAWESNLEAIPNLMESSSEMSSGYKEQCKKSQEDDINIFDIPTNDFGADVAPERTFASYREDLIKMIRGYQRIRNVPFVHTSSWKVVQLLQNPAPSP